MSRHPRTGGNQSTHARAPDAIYTIMTFATLAATRTRSGAGLAVVLAVSVLAGCSSSGPAPVEDGIQLVLAVSPGSAGPVTGESVEAALGVLGDRLRAAGIDGAQVSGRGTGEVVVLLPGAPDDPTLDLVTRPAQIRFRPVLLLGDPGASPVPDHAAGSTDVPPAGSDPSDPAWLTPSVLAEYGALDCTDPMNLVPADGDDPTTALVACQADGSAKYALGPVELDDGSIDSAAAAQRTQTDEWVVDLELTSAGAGRFTATTTRLAGLAAPQNQLAIVLDRQVVSAPSVAEGLTTTTVQVSGSFTAQSAATLARQLGSGPLPVTLTLRSQGPVPAGTPAP